MRANNVRPSFSETRCGIARNIRHHLGIARHDGLLYRADLDQHSFGPVFIAAVHDSDDVDSRPVREEGLIAVVGCWLLVLRATRAGRPFFP